MPSCAHACIREVVVVGGCDACSFLQALSGRRERIRRVVVGGTNARPSPPVAQATAQGANTSRAAAWRVRAALTPTAGIRRATAGRVAKCSGVGGACLTRVQGPFVTVDFIIGEVFDFLS